MEINGAARGALLSYLDMSNPKYAILVDAPWGCGKTHFIRKVCEVDKNQDSVRYVSLNGVATESEFRRALVKDSFKPELVSKAQYMLNVFSQKIKLGDLGDLARDVIEEHLISKLPETLIFDDIERAPIDSQVLFGLLNEFVEHQEKRIILIVHSDERKGKQEFLKRKEKLVGRTLAIEADFESSFPSFVELMNQGRGKEYFLDHADVVKTVFEEAGHQNLRLLRNAVRDCALVLDRVAEERFDAKEPTSRFVRTYLALSMALSKGEITLEDIAQRDSVDWMISGQDDQAKSPLKNLHERHSGADIFAHSGSVLPKSLAELLFEKGHAEDSELNSMLEATGQFEAQDEFPLWKRVIHFLEFDLNELETLGSGLIKLDPQPDGRQFDHRQEIA